MIRTRAGEIGIPQRVVTIPEPVPFVVPVWTPETAPTSPVEVPELVPAGAPQVRS